MTKDEVQKIIIETIAEIMDDKGLDVPEISTDTKVLEDDLGIDSLDLATMVSDLEGRIGFDPFSKGFIEFKTVGELAELYVQ